MRWIVLALVLAGLGALLIVYAPPRCGPHDHRNITVGGILMAGCK